MGILFWSFVAGVGAAGYLAYRKLRLMEDEIRAEIATGEPAGDRQGETEVKASAGDAAEGLSPEERIRTLVAEEPGILQTELYRLLGTEKKRPLQDLLREMDREGHLKRVREKGTYRLFPGD